MMTDHAAAQQRQQPLQSRTHQLIQFTFTEAGPLGIVFGDVDLADSGESAVVVNSIRGGSMASQQVGLVPGLVVHAVQGFVVAGDTFDDVLGRIKVARCVGTEGTAWHGGASHCSERILHCSNESSRVVISCVLARVHAGFAPCRLQEATKHRVAVNDGGRTCLMSHAISCHHTLMHVGSRLVCECCCAASPCCGRGTTATRSSSHEEPTGAEAGYFFNASVDDTCTVTPTYGVLRCPDVLVHPWRRSLLRGHNTSIGLTPEGELWLNIMFRVNSRLSHAQYRPRAGSEGEALVPSRASLRNYALGERARQTRRAARFTRG
jgi:hypothetical protein